MKQLTIEQTADYLKNCEDVHILIHRSPDGDCIGAGYSLQAVFRLLGKRAKVLCADPIPPRFDYLMPKEPEEDFAPKCIISTDVSDEKLFGSLEPIYGGKVELCIDHHVSNLLYAQNVLLEPNAAAACETLYKVYRAMGIRFTEQIAMCLYTGIATDTGCFKYSNANADTHMYTSEIMREFPDIRYDLINREMFTVKSRGALQAEMLMLANMEYHCDGKVTLVWATQDVCLKSGVDPKDMEGITSISLQPEGVEIGLTVREPEPGLYKVSMRSAKDINVSALCAQLGGGGHIKAAGCTMTDCTRDEVRERLLAVVRTAL